MVSMHIMEWCLDKSRTTAKNKLGDPTFVWEKREITTLSLKSTSPVTNLFSVFLYSVLAAPSSISHLLPSVLWPRSPGRLQFLLPVPLATLPSALHSQPTASMPPSACDIHTASSVDSPAQCFLSAVQWLHRLESTSRGQSRSSATQLAAATTSPFTDLFHMSRN